MNIYIHFNRLPAEAIGIVTFIDRIDKLFDILNSTIKYNGEKEYAHVFKGLDFSNWILKWLYSFFWIIMTFWC